MNIKTAKPMAAKAFRKKLSATWSPLYDAKQGRSSLPADLVPESMRDQPVGRVFSRTDSDRSRFAMAAQKLAENRTIGGATGGRDFAAGDVIDSIHRRSTKAAALAVVSAVGFGLSCAAASWGFSNLGVVDAVLPSLAAVGGGVGFLAGGVGMGLGATEAVLAHRSADRLEQWNAHFNQDR